MAHTKACPRSGHERAQAVADRLEAGMVFVNHPTASEPNLPFGGVERSGFGRELSHLGVLEFANRKLIATTARRADPRRPGLVVAPGARTLIKETVAGTLV